MEHTEVTLFEKIEKSFKEQLQLSPEFFRLFLTTEKTKFISNIEKLNGFLEERNITIEEYNPNSNNRMEIYGRTFDINRIFKLCFYRDVFKQQNYRESIEYLKQIECELPYEEESEEYEKYVRTETRFSDLQIEKLKQEVKKYLNQIKKEISNIEIEKLKESVDHIWLLRLELIDYIIKTKNGISDAEITKLL